MRRRLLLRVGPQMCAMRAAGAIRTVRVRVLVPPQMCAPPPTPGGPFRRPRPRRRSNGSARPRPVGRRARPPTAPRPRAARAPPAPRSARRRRPAHSLGGTRPMRRGSRALRSMTPLLVGIQGQDGPRRPTSGADLANFGAESDSTHIRPESVHFRARPKFGRARPKSARCWPASNLGHFRATLSESTLRESVGLAKQALIMFYRRSFGGRPGLPWARAVRNFVPRCALRARLWTSLGATFATKPIFNLGVPSRPKSHSKYPPKHGPGVEVAPRNMELVRRLRAESMPRCRRSIQKHCNGWPICGRFERGDQFRPRLPEID